MRISRAWALAARVIAVRHRRVMTKARRSKKSLRELNGFGTGHDEHQWNAYRLRVQHKPEGLVTGVPARASSAHDLSTCIPTCRSAADGIGDRPRPRCLSHSCPVAI